MIAMAQGCQWHRRCRMGRRDNAATTPPLATIAARLFCVNPAGIFFLAAFFESLFAMLTFAGHAFVTKGRYFECLLHSEGGVADYARGVSRGRRSGGCGALLMVVAKLQLTILALLPSSLPILHNYGQWQWTVEAAVDNNGCGGSNGRQRWWWWMTAVVEDNSS
jgi:hypothetical protein